MKLIACTPGFDFVPILSALPTCQRENREDYIAKLNRDLASLPAGQGEENDSDDEWMSSQVRLVPAQQRTKQ